MNVILCYGDSNTHGTKPVNANQTLTRYTRGVPWPDKMGSALGTEYLVISEGLPGRTTVHDDPISGGMRSGIKLLSATLHSHEPIDLLVLMLGTNDLKFQFSSSSFDIAQSVDRIIKETKWHAPGLDIMIISPASVSPSGVMSDLFSGAEILQKDLVSFWAMEFQENLLSRFTDLYELTVLIYIICANYTIIFQGAPYMQLCHILSCFIEVCIEICNYVP